MNPIKWLRDRLIPERKARLDATQRMDASYVRFMTEVKSLEIICHDMRSEGINLDPFVSKNSPKRIKHEHD